MPLLTTQSARSYGLGRLVSYDIGDYYFITSQTVGAGGTAQIDFNSIPTTYKHLQLRYIGKSGRSNSSNGWLSIKINGSWPDYASSVSYVNGTMSEVTYTPGATTGYFLAAPGTTANSACFGQGVIDFLDYRNTNKLKVATTTSSVNNAAGDAIIIQAAQMLNSTSAITSISILSTDGTTIQQNTKFSLYGIVGN